MKRSSWTLATVALGAGAVVATIVLVTPGASATQGQPVIAGQDNTATDITSLYNPNDVAVEGTGNVGVLGLGKGYGVEGSATADGATGVFGKANEPTGIGVYGTTTGSGSGVYGEATGLGAGLNGFSARGVGVEAQSGQGTALKVVGKVSFSRSGVVMVPAGALSRTVHMPRVNQTSMVLATAQQSTAVFVKAAVPSSGKFIIRLTGKAPVGGLRVAYFVLH